MGCIVHPRGVCYFGGALHLQGRSSMSEGGSAFSTTCQSYCLALQMDGRGLRLQRWGQYLDVPDPPVGSDPASHHLGAHH
eukprot:2934927-Prorocentrum_lima.AAC.1